MRHFGLFLENRKASLVDLDTGEILADNDRYLIGWYLRAYENEFTLTLIQGLNLFLKKDSFESFILAILTIDRT